MNFDEKCQILILGDSTVGKTSILLYYIYGKFYPQKFATIGLDFVSKDEVIDERVIRVKIWDTAGQERYKSLTQGFLRSSEGSILVYDVNCLNSFENLKFWIASLRMLSSNLKKLKMMILGNKIDKERVVDREQARNFAKENNIEYFEVSAKTGEGIKESFLFLIKEIIKEKGMMLNGDRNSLMEETSKLKFEEKKNIEKKKCHC